MKNYSEEIVQAIKDNLEENDIKLVAFDEEDGTFGFVMHLRGPIAFVQYIIKTHEDDYTVIAICPVAPARNNRDVFAPLAEFVCRANHGLKNGNLEMDFDNGELRYKCFVNCDGQIPSRQVVRDSIAVPSMMLKRYAPGIIGVLYQGKDPEEAVEDCEKSNILDELEDAKRALLDMLRKRHMHAAVEHGLGDAILEDDDEPGIPSFEEYMRAKLEAEEITQMEDDIIDVDDILDFDEDDSVD